MKHMPVAIFDMDGTLIDSMPYWARSVVQILDEEKVPYPDDIVRILTPLGYSSSAKYYIETLGMEAEEDALVARMKANATPMYRDVIQLKPFVREYIEKLRSEGVTCCVLTASPHSSTDVCLKRNGIFDLFTQVWCTDDFGLTKDNPAIYQEAADRLHVDVKDIRFFDDNLVALQTAKKAGMEVIGVHDASSDDDRAAIEATAHRYVTSFQELL